MAYIIYMSDDSYTENTWVNFKPWVYRLKDLSPARDAPYSEDFPHHIPPHRNQGPYSYPAPSYDPQSHVQYPQGYPP